MFEPNLLKNAWMHANVNFFYAVNKTAVISHHYTETHSKAVSGYWTWIVPTPFHPIQLKSVGENKANSFCFELTLWPPAKVKVTDGGIKW